MAMRSRQRVWCGRAAAIGLVTVMLGGCAANAPDKASTVDDNALYEGKSSVTFNNLPIAKTVEDAMEWGDQASNLGEIDKALFLYIQALELDPKHTEAFYKIGWLHLRRNSLTKASYAFNSLLAIDDSHIRGHEARGVILLRQNEAERARRDFMRAMQLDIERLQPEMANPVVETTKSEQPDAADIDPEQTATVPPEPSLSERLENMTAEAIRQLPYDRKSPAQAYNGLGVIADLAGQHPRAQAFYDLSLAIVPNDLTTLNNKGYSLYLENRFGEAQRLFQRVLKANPQFSQAWRNLGLLYARTEHYSDALTALEQVMDSAEAHNDVGYVCMLAGKYDLAEYYFNQALSISPRYYAKAQDNLNQLKRLREKAVSQR
ncbi:tetratricopeptide repeat protein [Marinobacterium arenosum]|uniref:tetratricopeptide repeat protein n=1 Tax=Marinobacterium arenosum TaxID=2862496 RepID=UPI001C950820|nr:tetratricopeptide repeat protein [Marinobacterium arenosum]MBY4675743.1 tetratricopeptide repeat protein [Marinobacterium arenosum]